MTRFPNPARRPAALALLGALALSGCANVHSIEVGSVPDDYRTRHPIVVTEAEERLDLAVVSTQTHLSNADRSRLADFASRFGRAGADSVRVELPYGSANAPAAERLSAEIVEALRGGGVPAGGVFLTAYHAQGWGGAVPVRLVFSTLKAKTGPCGRWPEDLGSTHENRNFHNFGCASQQNLAAQIADPRDLLGPRGVDPIDAERRTTVLDNYRAGKSTATQAAPSDLDYSW